MALVTAPLSEEPAQYPYGGCLSSCHAWRVSVRATELLVGHNAYHNGWARRRYVPKTGRRYLTRGDRAAVAASQGPDTAP